MQHQEILLGQPGQSFQFDPPGRPAASPTPKVAVFGGRQVAATIGACSVDPVDTVLFGDAHAGTTTIRVASSEGIVPGGRYLMTKPEGDHEWIEVVEVRDCLVLRHPLIHRYAGAATIVGCRISVAVDPAWSAAATNLSDSGRRSYGGGLAGYLVRWEYTLGGVEVTGVSFADLLRYRSCQVVTPSDVDQRFPNWIADLPSQHRGNQGADFIAEAMRAVRLEAVGDLHAQRRISDTQVLRELVNTRANVIRLEQDVMYGAPLSAELAVAEQRYRSCYERLVYLRRPTSYVQDEELDRPIAKGSEPGMRLRIPKLTNH